MPKYLIQATYSAEGFRGLLHEGGSKRRAAVEEVLRAVGGKLEAFYYAFGGTDVYVIEEMPDNVTAAAISMATNATGAVNVQVRVLLTPEEIDEAVRKRIPFRAPGH